MTTLTELCAARGVTIESKLGAALQQPVWEATKNWRVTLSYQGRDLSFDYFGGEAVPDPSPVDALGSLLVDAVSVEHSDTFEQWADDMGFDPDSRKAEKLYEACKATVPQLRALLGDDYELFARAEAE